MYGLTYDRVLDFWLRNRKITIYVIDSDKQVTVFAASRPHSHEYQFQLQRALDYAESFQIGAGHPMTRRAFEEIVRHGEAQHEKRCA